MFHFIQIDALSAHLMGRLHPNSERVFAKALWRSVQGLLDIHNFREGNKRFNSKVTWGRRRRRRKPLWIPRSLQKKNASECFFCPFPPAQGIMIKVKASLDSRIHQKDQCRKGERDIALHSNCWQRVSVLSVLFWKSFFFFLWFLNHSFMLSIILTCLHLSHLTRVYTWNSGNLCLSMT